jgi:parvulin-like peptidyl-prolyl isomerase
VTLERDERQRVLDRLVEEELLLQRALELGLVRSDVRIRDALTHAVIEAAASMDDAVPSPANEADVRRFFDENRADFAEPARLTVEQIFYRADSASAAAERRAAEAYARLSRGESFETLKATGDPEAKPLPLGPVAPAQLADYVGANGVREALSLGPGAVSKPFNSAWGAHLIRVRAREPARIPAFEEVRDAVAAEYRRRTGDRRLRRYVEDLRRQATIELAEDAP